jgi:hypothetical protein
MANFKHLAFCGPARPLQRCDVANDCQFEQEITEEQSEWTLTTETRRHREDAIWSTASEGQKSYEFTEGTERRLIATDETDTICQMGANCSPGIVPHFLVTGAPRLWGTNGGIGAGRVPRKFWRR